MFLVMTCGYCNYGSQTGFSDKTSPLLTLPGDTPHTVFGKILRVHQTSDGGKRLDLKIHHMLRQGRPFAASGGLRLSVAESERRFMPGDEIAVRTRLRIPRRFGTPGEFDYPRYLADRGMQFTGFVPDDAGVAMIQRAKQAFWPRLRSHIGQLIDRSATSRDQAALIRALVIGDKDLLSRKQRQNLAQLGLSHLFSISGFHLGLVAMFGYFTMLAVVRSSEAFLLLVPPRRLLPCLLMPLLWCYLQMVGQALPVTRAWLAAVAVAALFWSRRCCQPARVALAVAGTILVAKPTALFTPSFQLSFAGVFGILILMPRWIGILPARPIFLRRIAQLGMVTTAAGIVTTPLVLWHFHMLAPAGLLINLWAGPVIGGIAIPVGLGGMLLSPLWPAAAGVCFRFMGVLVESVLKLSTKVPDLPLLAARKLYLPLPALLLISLMVAMLLLPWRKRHALLLAALLAALCLWPPSRPEQLRVTALSVGQGDALLVSDCRGRHYLIDGGGMAHSTFDTGERLVAPALGRLGIRKLTAVILSHDHPDHRNGLVHILKHFPVQAFWCAIPEKDLWPPLRKQLEDRHIPVRIFQPGWTLVEDTPALETAVFVPPQTMANFNDRSVVFYTRFRKDGILLTGDLESSGIDCLLKAWPSRPVSLLKLPHHGSRSSPVDLLLARFSPRQVFVSLGFDNPFGFPHRETLTSLEKYRLPLWRTDLHGTVAFDLKNGIWHVRSWQNGLFR
ncbi:MAG: competence protein ComEC [Desulfuromonadales bacterium]|jgi:competence protein ComEC|nr:competence protein ComEC [Desulfuromonadales bacterium]